eukprot:jgi/Orpsp1_1/1185888/evm.model.c7180000095852.1
MNEDIDYFRCSETPYRWKLTEDPYSDIRKKKLKKLKQSYSSMSEYREVMEPLFHIESKEEFRSFNETLNEGEIKYKDVAVKVDVKGFKQDYDTNSCILKINMPFYFISGYDGMNYKTNSKHKEKRSSGELKMNDLLYLAKVSEDFEITYFKTLVFFRRKSNIVYDINSIFERDFTDTEINRERGQWICIHISSFGSVVKEYNALLELSKIPKFPICDILTSGKINKIGNTITSRTFGDLYDSITDRIISDHKLTSYQAKIFKDIKNEKFGLIQGPPGTGKTTMIVAITERELLYYEYMDLNLKILICAPSNYACDEIARRLEKGTN